MKPLLIAALTFVHCSGYVIQNPICKTRCGLQLEPTTPNTWNCADMQTTEDRALEMFRKYSTDQRLWSCGDKLQGYYVIIHPTFTWIDEWNRKVSGLTDCYSKVIELGVDTPHNGAMTHELAHALQGCEPLPPIDTNNPTHSNWDRDGIYKAIDEQGGL